MTFDAYIDKKFKENLEVAREEVLLECNEKDIDDVERRAWRFAVEWTQEDVIIEIGRRLEQKWWQKQDSINKAFYQ